MKAVGSIGRLLALAGLLGAAAAPAPAQTARGVQTVYTNRTAFSLPVRMDERDRAELKELKFYVRAATGPRAGEWDCKETASPTKAKFAYQAPQDGEYWFAFVTVDKAGQVAPADLNKSKPGLVVVVDTEAPDIDVQRLPAASGEVFLQCQLKDANPDYASIRLEYAGADRAWRPLEPAADAPGVFRVPDPAVLHGTVRASAADKAGNRAVREINLGPDAGAAAAVDTRPPANTAPPPLAPVRADAAPPAARVAEKPAAPDLTTAGRQLINSLHCKLDYALETPSVTRVEAYGTRDGGKTWQKLAEDPGHRSPIEFDLPEDGVWGIALALGTAGRPAEPPAAGDAPDYWVEADTTRPAITVHDVHRGSGDDAGQLILSWVVQDKNLGPEPVELFWASQPEGPWQSGVRGLRAEALLHWPIPAAAGSRLYLRLEATDRAGNVGRWEAREPILLETAKPRARVLGVSAGR
jgi:hypothetical protein